MSTDSMATVLLQRNKQIATTHEPIPYLSELTLAKQGVPKLLIVTCTDPRNVPEKYLGLGPRGGILDAAVIRNICGHVRPALNDIIALDHLIGLTEIMVIHHTDCGSLQFTNSQVCEGVKSRVPDAESVDHIDFGAITDIEQSVRDDLAILKGSKLVRKELADRASGYVFDLKTGLLSVVES